MANFMTFCADLKGPVTPTITRFAAHSHLIEIFGVLLHSTHSYPVLLIPCSYNYVDATSTVTTIDLAVLSPLTLLTPVVSTRSQSIGALQISSPLSTCTGTFWSSTCLSPSNFRRPCNVRTEPLFTSHYAKAALHPFTPLLEALTLHRWHTHLRLLQSP